VFLINPLEATPVDIARYLAWLGQRGTIAADSLQPYLSAINRYLQDHAREPVALGPLVARVRKGLANSQEDTRPLPERVPLPAQVACAILELGEQLLREIRSGTDPRVPLLRAAVATIASYMFFNRGACGAGALRGDLTVSDAHISLLLRNEKGHKKLGPGQYHSRQIACRAVPRIAAVLRAFFARQESSGSRVRRWALSPEEDLERWTADTSTVWLHMAYGAAGHQPPDGFSWTSHSLRKGAASAAYAIGARLTDIRYAGGWSTNSTVLTSKYIDFTMQPSPEARMFFDFLIKGPLQ